MFEITKHDAVTEVSFHENKNLVSLAASGSASNFTKAFFIRGLIDISKFQAAVHRLAMRHEALRTRFRTDANDCFSREILGTSDVIVEHTDCSRLPANDEAVQNHLAQITQKKFTPFSYPFVAVSLIALRNDENIFVLNVADFLFDAASISILIDELGILYAEQFQGGDSLVPLQYGLSDFVRSHNIWMQQSDYADRLGKLSEKISSQIARGGIDPLLFGSTSKDAFQICETFPDAAVTRMRDIARSADVSIATFLGVASASRVISLRETDGGFFTTSLSNRHYPHTGKLVGFIATTMPYFMDILSDENEQQRLRRWHMTFLATMSNYGMMPILDVGKAVARMHPAIPPGKNLKFGKVTINVRSRFEPPEFGAVAVHMDIGSSVATSNEYNFSYETGADGSIDLRVKGLAENQMLAERLVESLLEETTETAVI